MYTMRKIKYSYFIRSNYSLSYFPLRLLKFKKQKWLALQERLKKQLKPAAWKKKAVKGRKLPARNKKMKFQFTVSNPLFIKQPKRRWIKAKKRYLSEMLTKRSLYIYFSLAAGKAFLRKQTHAKKLAKLPCRMSAILIKPFFRVDTLLNYLRFFTSRRQTLQFLNRRKIVVNGLVIKNTVYLKRGDVVSLVTCKSKSSIQLRDLRNKYTKQKKILTFVEVDYYAKSLVLIKDLATLNYQDMVFILENRLDVKSFSNVF